MDYDEKIRWAKRMKILFTSNVDKHLENEELSTEEKLKKISNYFEDSITLVEELIAAMEMMQDEKLDQTLDLKFNDNDR